MIEKLKVGSKKDLSEQIGLRYIFCFIKDDRYSDKYLVLPKYTALIGLLKEIIFIIFVDIVDC